MLACNSYQKLQFEQSFSLNISFLSGCDTIARNSTEVQRITGFI